MLLCPCFFVTFAFVLWCLRLGLLVIGLSVLIRVTRYFLNKQTNNPNTAQADL